ncbi:THUMP-like domain-containing protein [Ohtaekwangia koreensis]|uniref:Uncharacterized protein n=1 Tax=Ohtaekwangia koreensis TaxID=688867 RepID=A0A1T5LHR5_9BACT|nr:class I SAM-dependent methyltransferase [Ohtaekwangia koreensis]SKC75520.1 hypothetical protein SAMN05660236_3260 [Ohtaekwangia koreensis]
MLSTLLTQEAQQFIHQHANDDERELVLKYKEIHGVPSAQIADQISGRRKAKDKLPVFYTTPNIIYPPGANLEQSSSEITAIYKTEIVKEEAVALGILVDLTGGFGIDTYFLSRIFNRVEYIEPNAALLAIARHNHTQLQATNIQYHSKTSEEYIKELKHTDLIFIDPSRRIKGQKVFKLSDCEPDVTVLYDEIFRKTDHLLIKTSPLLDIQQGLRELKTVKKVYIVSVANECKELLFLCSRSYTGEPEIEAVNILTNRTDKFSFTFAQERAVEVVYNSPMEYIYEPNASLLKAGAFKVVALRHNLFKIHPSTHLYTDSHYIQDFPGRIFKVEALIKSDRKIIQSYFPDGKANVITRNYPLSTEELKKKTGLKDGGLKFLIGFSGKNEKFLAVAERAIS